VGERLFTRDEANALAPRLRPLLERMRELQQEMVEPARLRRLGSVVAANGGGHVATDLMEREAELRRIASAVERMGIVVRDPSAGLVDFPAERDGRPVYLCWRLDEASVDHWHDREAGFAGREPL